MTGPGDASVLDVLCPMHIVISETGHITHAGPTARKLTGDRPMVGARFLEVFAVNRPRAVASMEDLKRSGGAKLHLEMRAAPHTALKAVLVPLPDGDGKMIVNLSFGISIVDGVRDYALSNADFAATDLAIEMLYLIEAKTAAMDESRRLNLRLQGAKVAAEQKADTDMLTGLANRRALNTVLTRLVAGQVPFAVMQIDLDYFKAVNDTLGHAAGDHVLQTVARIMAEETRKKDTVARVGGDEFTIVLADVRGDDILRRVGRRIINRLEEPISFKGQLCRISASIGTVWIQSGISPAMHELMDDADVALYASKHAGRARQTIYDPSLRDLAGKVSARDAPGQHPA
ncbi:GGDEF domain-containing protein [Sulfitobacter sp. EhC04]|uniref:GGDEF domain-containing protein n=1 Tax=Sulfitobacter sp. EhC04 TaxID=1849168 RepID=UPI000A95E7E8|nr:GGDEF domain-containing protein [Sulfitobacter sp. EhC04]